MREAVSFSKLAVSIALISAHRWDAISGCPLFSLLVFLLDIALKPLN